MLQLQLLSNCTSMFLSKFEDKMIKKNLQNQKWQMEQQTPEPTGQPLLQIVSSKSVLEDLLRRF